VLLLVLMPERRHWSQLVRIYETLVWLLNSATIEEDDNCKFHWT